MVFTVYAYKLTFETSTILFNLNSRNIIKFIIGTKKMLGGLKIDLLSSAQEE